MTAESIHFHRSDWVEVRPLADILATLDARGKCEELPFMPEMAKFCGRRFQVYRRAEKTFLDRHNVVVRLQNMVFLATARCDGQSHGGCQMGCLILWKEAWLQPVSDGAVVPDSVDPSCEQSVNLPTRILDRYCCQATELKNCGPMLPWWDCRQYVRDYLAREIGFVEWSGMLALLVWNKLRRHCGVKEHGVLRGQTQRTVNGNLNLQPGDWVEVRSLEEIRETLDFLGRNRGLGFSPEMSTFCGKRFQVLRRIEQVIVEWTGEMRPITNTVILDGVTCTGMARRCCPRDCYHLWREVWLKRVV
jgi:hypothetical protein